MEKRNVLKGSIKKHMLRLAIPSMGGMFAITVFNLTDTYFVSKLGIESLAAMGFTFPVVMVVGSISGGISLGAGSILARAMGQNNNHMVKRVATDGIILSILSVIVISILGLVTMKPLFYFLGARGYVLDQVMNYMKIWYLGAFVIIVPPVSDNSMRAMGDMTRPFFVMLFIAIINVILDPLLIFGFHFIPAMGIKGASLATIISRFIGMILSLYFVTVHYRLIDFRYKSINELFLSFKDILHIGLPNVLVRLLPQISRAVLTRLVADLSLGSAAVAALAAGIRIESFTIIISMAIGVAIIPIVGQNHGAGYTKRVLETRELIWKIAAIFGVFSFIVFLFFGKIFGSVFTKDEMVKLLISRYLIIMALCSIGLNTYNWISESFNAVGKPRYSLIINLIGTIFVIVPFMIAGRLLYGFEGTILGVALAQLVVGIFTYKYSYKILSSK